MESQAYHKSCFKCSHGGCPITPSNYAALEGILYCKHHFSQLFKEKGSYNHLIKSASIKRAAASVPESWMPVASNCLCSVWKSRMFWSAKQVFVCVVFFSLFITTVPSLLLPFSDIYLYMCGVQILCDLFIKSSAHSVLTNERLTCIMYLTNLMMQLFIAFSTWCYYISYLRRWRNIGGFGLLLPWVIKFRWPWMNLIHGMVILTVSLSTVFSRMSMMSSRENIGLVSSR